MWITCQLHNNIPLSSMGERCQQVQLYWCSAAPYWQTQKIASVISRSLLAHIVLHAATFS